ncbi:MAG: replicative DNA helicase [Rhodospirillaceae bacterium]|nr:MAG: replicative DNA helicase [Rhodospirillaceae bacterium]
MTRSLIVGSINDTAALGAFRVPPHNEEAEQALLGAILVNNRNYEKVADFLQPEHFANAMHGRIYALCGQMINRGMQADPITLRTYLEQDSSLAEAGGSSYLANLARPVVGIIDVPHYGRMIYDLFLRRSLVTLGEDVVNDAFAADVELGALQQIETAEQKLYDLATAGVTEGGLQKFAAALTSAIQMAETAHKRDGRLSGITTGFTDLNHKLGGLHPSDLIIIAARPAMGKTALVTNIAFNAAYERMRRGPDYGAQVAFFSLEMSSDQLAARILSTTTHISSHKMRTGTLSEDEFHRLAQTMPELERLPLFIDDAPGLAVSTIRTRARRLKRQVGLDLIVIDYLQLIASPPGRRVENRVQELSDLSRAVEGRDDKRPLLSDLRESGSIEQDADVVIFIFREEYYLERAEPPLHSGENDDRHNDRVIKWQEQLDRVRNKAEIIVAKQRHGPTGTINLYFNGEFTEFRDFDQQHGTGTPPY